MRAGLSRAGEYAAGPGKDLLQAWGGRSVQMTQRPLQDVAAFDVPVCACRRCGQVSQAVIGDKRVDRAAVGAEHLAKLGVGRDVRAVVQGRDAEDAPRPSSNQAAFCWVDAGYGTGRLRA